MSTGPVSGGDQSRAAYQRETHQSIQSGAQIIMEVEDILQQKFHDGQISMQEFTKLSKRLEGIQQQYRNDEVKENKANSQTHLALSQLKTDIASISGGGETAPSD